MAGKLSRTTINTNILMHWLLHMANVNTETTKLLFRILQCEKLSNNWKHATILSIVTLNSQNGYYFSFV